MMKSIVKLTLMATLISFIAINSNAQEQKPEVPVPVQNLMKFLGDWEANTTLTLGDKTYKVLYLVSCKKTADGNGIYADESFSHPDLGTLKGGNLAGFDPYDSKIKWYTVDNMGTTHEHIGEWKTPDHLYIEHNGMRDGKKYVEKINFTFTGKNDMDFKLICTLDGVEAEKAEGMFHKKGVQVKK